MQHRAVIGALLLAIAGCGGSKPPPKALAPVRLSIDSPADSSSVDADSVLVHGTVWPSGSEVRVQGRPADVSGGTFSASVSLRPGTNVIDVVAGAERRSSAMGAIRVRRLIDVTIPDVSGLAPEDADKRLRHLGLEVNLRKRGGLIDDLLPGSDGVCDTDPAAGASVPPGSSVDVTYGKAC